MSHPVNCPYCDKETWIELERQDAYNTYEDECSECNKKFTYTLEFSVDIYASKADCLNGGEHDYQEIAGYPKEYFENKRRCSICSKEIILNKGGIKI